MQIENNNRLNFPISCTSFQESWEKVNIKEDEEGKKVLYPIGKNMEIYLPFEKSEIVPSLIKIMEKIKNGSNVEKLIIEWVSKWGPLTYYEDQTVESFLFEAEKFYDIWRLYRAVTIRDTKFLKDVSEASEFVPDMSIQREMYLFKNGYSHIYKFFQDKYETDDTLLLGMNSNKPDNLQNAAMLFIERMITPYIEKGKLGTMNVNKTRTVEQDIYQITPCLDFTDLIDVLYMKLFMLLNEPSRKICPICNDGFVPKRVDKKYCSETCYNTAKNRRYRLKRVI